MIYIYVFCLVASIFNFSHSQLLAALKTYLIWITRNEKLAIDNLKLIVDVTLPVIRDSVPLKICNSAAYLFLGLSNLSCAPNLVALRDVVDFIHLAPTFKFRDNETNCIVHSAISNLLFKPWTGCSQEDSNNRTLLMTMYFNVLTRDIVELMPTSGEAKTRQVVELHLPVLSHIVDNSKDLPVASKKKLFAMIKTTVDRALLLFSVYAKNSDISNGILSYFLTVLKVLQTQLGLEETRKAVQIFLNIAAK